MATIAPAAATGWVVDRQFRGLITLLLVASFAFPLLPVGLVFDPAVRDAVTQTTATSSGMFRLMWLPLILLASYVVVLRLPLVLAMRRDINVWMLVLYGWILLSCLWAPSTGTALRQAISILGVWVLAVAEISASWSSDRWVVVLRRTALVMMVLSLIAGFAIPAVGVQPEDNFELAGSWRGITYQKNGLGQLSSLGLIFFLHAGLSGRMRMRSALGGSALALFLVLMSRSSTATLLAIIIATQLYLLMRPPLRMQAGDGRITGLSLALALIVPLVLYVILVGAFDSGSLAQSFTSLFGKDATFSGRTYIWAGLIDEIDKHPWLGIGFNSFWLEGKDGPAAELIRKLHWEAPNGHNAYIDLVNEVGLIGLGLLLVFLVMHIRDIRRLGRFDRNQAALHATLLLYMAIANLTEVGWFKPLLVTHVILMYSSLNVSRLLFEQRLRTFSAGAPSVAGPRPAILDAGTTPGAVARPSTWR